MPASDYGLLDCACPIEWSHPLNRGLIGKWLVPPLAGWRGGLTWWDLVRGGKKANNGTLTSGPTWAATKRAGGFGEIVFDGTNDYVSTGFNSNVFVNDTYTLACWAKLTNIATVQAMLSFGDDQFLNVSASDWRWQVNDAGGSAITSTTTRSSGAWVHYVLTTLGPAAGSSKMYTNGINQDNGHAIAGVGSGPDTLDIGREKTGPQRFVAGSIDDVTIYNRALTANDVWQLYMASLLGYPDQLRWSRRTSYSLPATVSTLIEFDAASNSGYQAAQTTYNWSHTCTGSNRFLVVGISLLSTPGVTVTKVSYGNINLRLLGSKTQANVTVDNRVEIWGTQTPATGSNTITVKLSASVDSTAGAVSFANVNPAYSAEGIATNGQLNGVTGDDATVSVTTVADNDWVVSVVSTDDTAITAGQTSRSNVTGASGSGGVSTTGPKTPAGSQAMNWTNIATLKNWAIAAIGLRDMASSGPFGAHVWKVKPTAAAGNVWTVNH